MDDGAVWFRPPRPRPVVLTSEKWLYALLQGCGSDCCVYSEVEQVCLIVEGDLAWLFGTHGGANSASVLRVLIGMPGIGKSVDACSCLLYQLLHYDAEQLHAVACFIGERAFLFDKTTKTVFSLGCSTPAMKSLFGGLHAGEGVYYLRCDGVEEGVAHQDASHWVGHACRVVPKRNSLQGQGGGHGRPPNHHVRP
ncbi:retrotransposon hot spot (RHS) protein [Trypanosoma rangeli]|uniref:Retrotransposon hot spot (RHS) protein n=1 Tax=Trypanosoma rangeli TaxID=5698 RepID=A0A3R7KJ24_TRYRA|nr:retrotransposon hot spot (RHS) protein [Trypanosoma rangeli]RNE95456.1 retrotransposon hot spot (RHS) protein [Trypanosoma rangeli]|eukprot:RNE95456.1 retrotransposon hot spot (RHS) protein [Trypanosoma rangeli]